MRRKCEFFELMVRMDIDSTIAIVLAGEDDL
ncbi:MAG: hypothetical protein ETSY2_47475 [Candidatus Entotheonella gemina]|uniref:Uncharacterized protein n=1 Tax=Candidatus Entotheonella gemina TaxID=1429439 RepID=W4LDW2_9BACT|nr:MAG: hypothetical protein ETSY2_47475 [Candidatus Entotheonella gemina]